MLLRLALPISGAVYRRGGLLSVALSLGSPPPVINRHRVSMEPGLSSPAAFRRLRVRPPGRLTAVIKVLCRKNARATTPRVLLDACFPKIDPGPMRRRTSPKSAQRFWDND